MRPESILLLGPTGVGKTPLGELIGKNGINGKKCHHFDFGSELRCISELQPADAFDRKELSFIRDVLGKGALFENGDFPLAEKIFRRFLLRTDFRGGDLLILNGMPRHTDQARYMDRIAAVNMAVLLVCEPGDVYRRIALDSGGDRSSRIDDSLEMIRRKIEIFTARTAPLIGHYAEQGCKNLQITITSDTTPEKAYEKFIEALSM
jgi:adenylate kinase